MSLKTDRAAQVKIGTEWTGFRKKYLFTQKTLADALGVSRRSIQYVESGKGQQDGWVCMPSVETLTKFKALKNRFEREEK